VRGFSTLSTKAHAAFKAAKKRLPRAVVEPPSLEGFKKHADVAPGDMV